MKLDAGRLKKIAPWFFGATSGGLLLFTFAASAFFHRKFVNPRRKQNKSSDLSNFVPESSYTAGEFSFLSTDGVRISGLRLEPEIRNGRAVFICHGLAHDKYSGVRYVQYLLNAGYTLVLIDFRNHGKSEGKITSYGHYEKNDLRCAIRYLRDSGFTGKIGLLGASMGASIALLAAAECDEIRAVVLDSPFSSLKKISLEWASKTTRFPQIFMLLPVHLAYCWIYFLHHFWAPEVEPAARARHVNCPVFLIHGGADERIPVSHSRDIYSNLPGEKELWVIEEAGHLGVYLHNAEEYQRRVLEFFRKNLL